MAVVLVHSARNRASLPTIGVTGPQFDPKEDYGSTFATVSLVQAVLDESD